MFYYLCNAVDYFFHLIQVFLQGRLLLVALSEVGGAETVFGFGLVAGSSQAVMVYS